MKILRLTKVIVSTLIIVLVLVLKPTGASAEWKQDSTGWWYTEGSAIINDLVVDIDGIRLINDNTRDGYAGTDRGRKEYKVMDLYKTYENNFIYYHAKTEQSRDILLYCYYTLV